MTPWPCSNQVNTHHHHSWCRYTWCRADIWMLICVSMFHCSTQPQDHTHSSANMFRLTTWCISHNVLQPCLLSKVVKKIKFYFTDTQPLYSVCHRCAGAAEEQWFRVSSCQLCCSVSAVLGMHWQRYQFSCQYSLEKWHMVAMQPLTQ